MAAFAPASAEKSRARDKRSTSMTLIWRWVGKFYVDGQGPTYES